MYKVIVVEDEDIIRKGLIFLMDWAKYNCSVVADCANGEEGLAAIQTHRPDIIITDISMPVMDGLEMIRRTYEEYDYSAIILSSYSEFEYAQNAIRYGVLRYLLKPLKKEELEEAICKAVQECEKKGYYASASFSLRESAEEFLKENSREYSGKDTLVREILDFVHENYQKKILMSDLVKRMNYSDTFLNKKFKEAMGTTFMEYVNRYRIQRAIEMLMNEGMAVQEVAWKCGIGEYKYFNTVFRKYVGCSPKEFVEGIRNK